MGAPPRRGRGPVFWVLTGCCGCLLLGLVGIGLIGGVAFFATQDVVQTVRAQLGELKAGNVEAAYARMSDTYKQSHRAQDFGAFAARHPGLKDNADSTFLTRRIENDRGHLEGTLTATSGAKESVTYALIKQSDGWRIEDIKFESESAASAAGGGGDDGDSLEVETVDLKKEPQGEGVRVSMRIRVTGFSVRPDDDGGFRMDLAEDLETIGPDGEKIPDLSRMALETLQEKTAQESGNSAEFTNTLTFGRPAPGSYVVRVTIRDLAGKNLKTHAIPFDLP